MADAQAELTRDLYAYLVDEFYSVPRPRRQRSCWVMNHEWLNECRKIDYWTPNAPLAKPVTMLGLPIHVTDDGGFPHLIGD